MKMAIDAHCLEGNRTGVGRYLSSILKEWRKANLKHEIILYFKDEIPEDFSALNNFFIPKLLPRIFGRRSTFLFIHFAIPKAVKDDSPQVFFAPEYIAPLGLKIPLVLTLHYIIYASKPKLHSWPSPFDRIFLGMVSKRAAKKAAAILVPSEFTKLEVMRVWSIGKKKIFITQLAAGKEFTRTQDKGLIEKSKNIYGITDKFFMFVGSAFPRRHVLECMKAFAKIADQNSDYQFLIAGVDCYKKPGILDTVAKNFNQELGREALVRKNFAASSDLPILYSAAEATIWLSDYEGFGLPPLESISCGTPVITNKAGSLPEVVGDCAFFVSDPSDASLISYAMLKIIEGGRNKEALQLCGPNRAKNFSWEQCAKQTMEILISCAGK